MPQMPHIDQGTEDGKKFLQSAGSILQSEKGSAFKPIPIFSLGMLWGERMATGKREETFTLFDYTPRTC